MELIREALKGVLENLVSKQKETGQASLEGPLKKILTKREFGHIRIKYFRKGVLCLHVDSSSWLYSFSLRKNNLLNELRKTAADIKEIRFYLGDVK